MRRAIVLVMLSLAATVMVAPDAAAQATERAYAPENLGSLSRRDQTRVIRNEYADQSGGRALPEDQLQFYLDQVGRSDWGFSDIKRDIATSLAGQRPSVPPARPTSSVACGSSNYRYRECRTGFRGHAALVQTTSKTRCVEGHNWGSRPGVVWVDQGCQGRFVEGRGAGAGRPPAYSVECASIRTGATSWCAWDANRGVPVLAQEHSGRRCVEGRTWGHVRARGIWVADGCSARFSTGR